MKKSRKTALGVLPKPRDTTEIGELNVLIEGQQPRSIATQHTADESIFAVNDANIGTTDCLHGKVPPLSAENISHS